MSARIIQVRPSRNPRWHKQDGWEVFEAEGVCPVYCGENSRAISTLGRLLATPYPGNNYNTPLTPVLLRLDPMFDPLRNDPRFQKLVASSAPKTADK